MYHLVQSGKKENDLTIERANGKNLVERIKSAIIVEMGWR